MNFLAQVLGRILGFGGGGFTRTFTRTRRPVVSRVVTLCPEVVRVKTEKTVGNPRKPAKRDQMRPARC